MGDTQEPEDYVVEQLRYLRDISDDMKVVDRDGPVWLGRRLYYCISMDAYFAYDHKNLLRYFGKFPNPDDAKARWRGWLRAGEAL